jgi:hypothetical protein
LKEVFGKFNPVTVHIKRVQRKLQNYFTQEFKAVEEVADLLKPKIVSDIIHNYALAAEEQF